MCVASDLIVMPSSSLIIVCPFEARSFSFYDKNQN